MNNNATMPQRDDESYDKLYKVRPFIESLKTNFRLQYHPHCEQSIDEAMVKYKGRTVLKQYMPMKPIKRGIKMWCRADSHSGYLCDFNIYSGKNKDGVEKGLGLGMFGMRKFRYRYTGKNIPVIPVYRYFGLVKS